MIRLHTHFYGDACPGGHLTPDEPTDPCHRADWCTLPDQHNGACVDENGEQS